MRSTRSGAVLLSSERLSFETGQEGGRRAMRCDEHSNCSVVLLLSRLDGGKRSRVRHELTNFLLLLPQMGREVRITSTSYSVSSPVTVLEGFKLLVILFLEDEYELYFFLAIGSCFL